MDYSIHDAIEAGFNKIVFIIRKDIKDAFKEAIGDRIEKICKDLDVEIAYAYQELNKIAYNVLSALYQPFWAAVLLAFLTMFLYLYGKEHGWKKNNFIRNMFATWWRTFKNSSTFRRIFLLAFYTAMILLRTVLNREIWFDPLGKLLGGWGLYAEYHGIFPQIHHRVCRQKSSKMS